jgi:lactate permease
VTLAALAPLLAVLLLLGSGRASTVQAGAAGLGLTLLLGWLYDRLSWAMSIEQTQLGLWLAWRVVAVILAGLFFARCLQTWPSRSSPVPLAPAAQAGVPGAWPDPRTLWVSCFALGPFVEAVTGFGVGYLILLLHLRRLGLSGMPLLVLGLYSQTLVPWGALAVGTVLGAELAGISAADMGMRAALVQAPMHLAYLFLYWRFCTQAGMPLAWRHRLADLAWTALLLSLLWAVNRFIDLEIGGVVACGLIVLAHEGLRPAGQGLRAGRSPVQVLHAIWPLVLVAGVLCLTRLPALQGELRQWAAWQALDGQPAFHAFAHPAIWLVLCGAIVLVCARAAWGPVMHQTLRLGIRPASVTVLFVVMAQCYVGAGFADHLAAALQTFAGPAALLVVPVFAAVAGFLTGTGAASNAMLMPMVTALSAQAGVSVPWMAAVQATVSTNLTLLSPMRVAMGIAFDEGRTSEAALYRAARVLAGPALLAGAAAVVLLVWAPD